MKTCRYCGGDYNRDGDYCWFCANLMATYPENQLELCDICYNDVQDNYACPNGHTVCDDCVERIKIEDEFGIYYRCPFCRETAVIEFNEGSCPEFPIILD